MSDVLDLFGVPTLRCLGAPNARVLDWDQSVALLAFLACKRGWHSRHALAILLRPDANSATGRAYLRRLLHRTKCLFPGLTALEVDVEKIQWAGKSDVTDFEAAIAQQDWERAIGLQRSPLLNQMGSTGRTNMDDWFYEEWIRLRDKLKHALIGAIEQRTRGNVSSVDLMQKLAEHDPMDEFSVQFLLRHATNPLEQHIAISAFNTLGRRLAVEMGVQPQPVTLDYFKRLQAAENLQGGHQDD